ncbi:hypothetical protein RHMOL_Rhmol02G0171400 [Rhododendron molle]|uniref:Uncharacterized protein n=1 Tax=Rhododendron molle TaxID=49168 RepID=A0ACC0PTX1_RHOML|nr:hypothetical protein RHMOL_Rhmol02G0171400 [Rhododendron molle]
MVRADEKPPETPVPPPTSIAPAPAEKAEEDDSYEQRQQRRARADAGECSVADWRPGGGRLGFGEVEGHGVMNLVEVFGSDERKREERGVFGLRICGILNSVF